MKESLWNCTSCTQNATQWTCTFSWVPTTSLSDSPWTVVHILRIITGRPSVIPHQQTQQPFLGPPFSYPSAASGSADKLLLETMLLTPTLPSTLILLWPFFLCRYPGWNQGQRTKKFWSLFAFSGRGESEGRVTPDFVVLCVGVWASHGIASPSSLPETDGGSRPVEINMSALLLIQLLEIWLRSMTIIYSWLPLLRHSYPPVIGTLTHHGLPIGQSLYNLLYHLQREDQNTGRQTQKGKHRGAHTLVCHSKSINYTSHFPSSGEIQERKNREISALEQPPHRKHKGWG